MIKTSFNLDIQTGDMGFQRPPSYKKKQQSVPKTTKDVEDKGDSFTNTRIPFLSPCINDPIALNSNYNSWVVSFFLHIPLTIYIYLFIHTPFLKKNK